MKQVLTAIKVMFEYYYDLVTENKFLVGINTIPYIVANLIFYARLYG